jgi:hypothetical protein
VFQSCTLVHRVAQVEAAGGSVVTVDDILSAVVSALSGRWRRLHDGPNRGPKES